MGKWPRMTFEGTKVEGFVNELVFWFVFIILLFFNLVSAPILLVVHLFLRAFGRRGLVFRNEDGGLCIKLIFMEISKMKKDKGGKR